jgi:hypothetical protein
MPVRNLGPDSSKVDAANVTGQYNSQQNMLRPEAGVSSTPRKPSLAENLFMTLKLLVIGGGIGLLLWLLDTIRVR